MVQAVLLVQQNKASAAVKVLEPLFEHVEPMQEHVAVRVCVLLTELYLANSSFAQAARKHPPTCDTGVSLVHQETVCVKAWMQSLSTPEWGPLLLVVVDSPLHAVTDRQTDRRTTYALSKRQPHRCLKGIQSASSQAVCTRHAISLYFCTITSEVYGVFRFGV